MQDEVDVYAVTLSLIRTAGALSLLTCYSLVEKRVS